MLHVIVRALAAASAAALALAASPSATALPSWTSELWATYDLSGDTDPTIPVPTELLRNSVDGGLYLQLQSITNVTDAPTGGSVAPHA